MKTTIFISFVLNGLLLTACGGGSDEPRDAAPEMTITNPVVNQTLVRPSDFMLVGTFTDDIELASMECSLVFKSAKKGVKGIEDPWVPANYLNKEDFAGKKRVDFNNAN